MKCANQECTVVNWEDAQGHHSALIEDARVQAWLAEGNTPEPADPLPNPRIAEIQTQLQHIDAKKIRAMTDAIVKNDKKRLEDLEAEAEVLRIELAGL